MLKRALVYLLLVTVGVTLAGREVLRLWETPLNVPAEGYSLLVAPGDTLTRVADNLHRDGVLAHPTLLVAYGRMTGLDASIKRGEYLLPEYSTGQSLLELLNSGDVVQYQVTFPEGVTLAQARDILRGRRGLQPVPEAELNEQLKVLAEPYPLPEGLFFPDSYQYTGDSSTLDILRRARQRMDKVLQREWQNREEALPYKTPYEALIMASIIEKETGLASEREEIAGVFVRRLERGMRLQTDPTVIYGLGPAFDGNLKRSHLEDVENPYNTYRHHGLPPSPIALPGEAAIHAALHPAPGNSLYFVARGDGGHVFSTSLAAHQKAVRKYQLQRRKNYRSAP